MLNGSLGRAQDLDGGLAGNTKPLTVILREPLSGTMNVMEYSVPRNNQMLLNASTEALSSQEAGMDLGSACNPGVNCANPLFLPGPGGSKRVRGIGNGQVTNGVSNNTVGGVKNTANSLAYAFFSYGNVSKFTGVGRHRSLRHVGRRRSLHAAGHVRQLHVPERELRTRTAARLQRSLPGTKWYVVPQRT